jgi:hypothetical protein
VIRLRFAPLVAALISGSALLLVTTRDARAIGQATGRVTGTVTEAQTQAPVPGADVTLTGGSGVRKKTKTGEDGSYTIDFVPPGVYDLLLTYEGMKPIKRKVEVNPDQASTMNIAWSAEATQEETMEVHEERHLTNPDSPQTGQIYSTSRTNQLPMGRSYQSVASQIPGVTAGGGNPNVKGARANNNRFLVNGLDTTDPTTNTFAANYQQDSLDSVQVITGGFEAKYNALGSVINVQTKRGTNDFHGAVSGYWAPSDFVGYDTYGPQTWDGEKPWDYSKERPEQGSYSVNLSAQGPILKDHIFFNVGLEYQRQTAAQPAGPPRFIQAPPRVFQSIKPRLGVTFVPVDEHRIHVEGSADPTTIDYNNNGGASANASTPYSQGYQNQGGYIGTVEWSWLASKHVATKVLLGYSEFGINVGPQGLRGIESKDLINGVPYSFNRAAHSNATDGTAWFNTGSHTVTTRRRYQADASVTVTGEAGGHHEAEFGVQTAYLEQRLEVSNSGGLGGPDTLTGYGVTYADSQGGPLDTGLCDMDPGINPGVVDGNYTGTGCFRRTFRRNYASHQSGNTFGVYLQDRWKPKKWLTLLPGIRADVGTVRATDSNVALTAAGFGPRMSVMGDVTNDGKTILQVSYGRTTEMPSLTAVSQYDTSRRAYSMTESYNATSRRFEFLSTAGGPQGTRFNLRRTAATADEFLLSGRRELGEGVMARVDYTYRYLQNQFEGMEVNAIMDPTGTRTLGYVNGNPNRVTEYGYNPKSKSEYSGLDLILETHLKNFEVQGGYTLSWSWGPSGTGLFDNPRFAPFYYSYQGVDRRHAIKTSTTYSIHGLSIGMILNWLSGSANAKGYSAATDEAGAYGIVRAPIGYEPGAYYNTGTGNPGQLGTYSDVRSWTAFRDPDVLSTSVLIGYDFHELVEDHVYKEYPKSHHLVLNVSISNLLALTTSGVSGGEGAPNSNQFGVATGRLAPRSFTLGLRYDF